MKTAHKIRMNPTPEQVEYLKRACGTRRFIYNWGRAHWEAQYQAYKLEQETLPEAEHTLKPPGAMSLKKQFNAIRETAYPWTYDVTKCVVEGAFRHLGQALANFAQSKRGERKGQRVRFPRFKSKRRGHGSFVLNNDKFRVEGHALVVPKLGRVNMAEALRFDGKILGAVISEQAGWWWVSVHVELPAVAAVPAGHALGVDVGVKDLAVDSDGQRHATRTRVPRPSTASRPPS